MSQKILKLLVGSLVFLVAISVSASAADKEKDEETLRNAHSVLQAMLTSNSVPMDMLAKAECIIVMPNVKKMGFVVGGSSGRGPMLCKTGRNGTWSAPAMYSIGGISAGLQIGGSSTDHILLVLTKKGVNALLQGKTGLGAEATVAAGPGATGGSVGADIATYSRAKGLFVGASLGGGNLEPDNDANKRLYDKSVSVTDIVINNTVSATDAGRSLTTTLNGMTAR